MIFKNIFARSKIIWKCKNDLRNANPFTTPSICKNIFQNELAKYFWTRKNFLKSRKIFQKYFQKFSKIFSRAKIIFPGNLDGRVKGCKKFWVKNNFRVFSAISKNIFEIPKKIWKCKNNLRIAIPFTTPSICKNNFQNERANIFWTLKNIFKKLQKYFSSAKNIFWRNPRFYAIWTKNIFKNVRD